MDLLVESTPETNASSSDEEDDYWDRYYDMYEYCNLFVILLTIVTVLYGFTSWILIQKWRTFRNYALTNISAAAFLKHLLDQVINTSIVTDKSYWTFYSLYTSTLLAYNFWLLVLCILFYSTIVKIFKPPVHGRFWKSTLLAWGLPTILGAINFVNGDFDFNAFDALIYLLPYSINFVIFVTYMIVLRTLLKRGSDIRCSNSNRGAKIQMATLLFLMSGVASVAFHIIDEASKAKGLFALVADNADLLPSIIIAIWVFAAKSNRIIVQDYYRNRLRNSVNTATIDLA